MIYLYAYNQKESRMQFQRMPSSFMKEGEAI